MTSPAFSRLAQSGATSFRPPAGGGAPRDDLHGEGSGAPPRPWEAVIVAVAVAVIFFTCADAFDLLVGTFNDDGVYVALGKALSGGAGYHSIHLAGDPVQGKYPPGLPALLALFWTLTGSLDAVQGLGVSLSILATAAAAGLVWWYARTRLGVHPALAAVLAVGPLLLDASTQLFSLIMSEPYFLLGWAGALLLHARLRDADEPRERWRGALALGLVLAATTLVRAQGLLLVALLIPTLPWRGGRWRESSLCAAVTIVPLAIWQVAHSAMMARGPLATQPDEAYATFIGANGIVDLFRVAAASVATNAGEYVGMIGPNLTGIPGVGAALFVAAVVLAIGGGVRLGRTHPALVLTVLANVLAVLAWPFTQDRLLLTVLPFAGLLAAAALQPLAARANGNARLALWLPLAAAAALIAIRQPLIRGEARSAPPADHVSTASPSFLLPGLSHYNYVVSRWLLAHTSPGDRVLVSTPAAIYLYTGRKGVPAQPSENRFTASLFREPGRYFASRIMQDSVTIVLMEDPRSQSAREIAAIQRRCPRSLRYLGSVTPNTAPLFFAATPADDCLRREWGNGSD